MSTLAQSQDTIREVYRGLLGREGDDHGVSAHGANLHHGAPLARLLGDFMDSAEFHARQSERVFSGLIKAGSRGDPISTVMSLGMACFTASMLRRAGLRQFSGPFDWLFGSSRMVEHALADDFTLLLDPRQLVAHPPHVPGGQPRCQHLYYRDVCGFPEHKPVFNHHDPLGVADRARFERAIERMRRVLRGNSASLLLQLVGVLPDAVEQFRSLAGLVDRIAPAAHLRVVAVGPPKGHLTAGASLWDTAGRHRLIYFEPMTGLADLGFIDPLDDLVLLRAATAGLRLDLRG